MNKLSVSEIRQAIRQISCFDETDVQGILQTISCRLAQRDNNGFHNLDNAEIIGEQLDDVINNLHDMLDDIERDKETELWAKDYEKSYCWRYLE